uniref:EF-hand domain-containing protein n=1 Tax=Panagrellus redivivus TaxID=6233 RepID=A0A7E4VHS8_PANRE
MLQSNDEKLKLPSDELLEAAFHALIAADGGTTQSSVQNSKEVAGSDALTKEKFVSLMTTHGEVLSENEVNEMLSHLSIRKNGIIDWRAYIRDVRLAIDERKKCEKSKDGSSA